MGNLGGGAPRVVAAGECMLELSRQHGSWQLGAAGDSFNTALYLRRLGADVRYFTALGDDPFSQEMLQSWQVEGLDTSLVLRDPQRLPGLYAIRTDEAGERSFYYWREQSAVRRLFALGGIDAALAAAADCDLLYLTGITLSLFEASERRQWRALASEVRRRGGAVAFDPNYRPRGWSGVDEARDAMQMIAPEVSYWLTTDGDEKALYGSADAAAIVARWQGAGVQEVIVKQGARGATVNVDASVVGVPVDGPVNVVDSTAAGDSFNAAYLMARMGGADVREAASRGNRMAGAVIQVPGAILPASQMPF